MTEAQRTEWKEQAEKAELLDDYEYHLGAVENPLPFQVWKRKFDSLNTLQSIPETDPRYFADSTFRREQELCIALGY